MHWKKICKFKQAGQEERYRPVLGPSFKLTGKLRGSEPGVDRRLASHAGGGILREDRVEDGVADVVRDLVGVTRGDGLGGEEGAFGHGATPRAGAAPGPSMAAAP